MNELEMAKGMRIVISKDPSNTRRTHTVNAAMRNMREKQYAIQRVKDTHYGLAAEIEGWTWHPKDLTEACPPEKEPQIFHFDIKELVT